MIRHSDQPDFASREEIAALLGETAGPPPLSPTADVFDRALRGARSELARTREAPAPATGLPRFFRRELIKLSAAVAVPTALLVALHLSLLGAIPVLLGGVLPEAVIWFVSATYAASSLGWLALAVGTVPFAAHRRALMRGRREP
ncbi:MAG: hypothetical protein QNK05_19230 [Myxococcota bacterium]|nr:hypothetical protein [Myxococcota bacterium]